MPTKPSMKCGGPTFPQGWTLAVLGERQTLAAAEPLGEPDRQQATGVEPAIRAQPENLQGLPAERSLDRLWTSRYEGAMLNYVQPWFDPLCGQGLEQFQMRSCWSTWWNAELQPAERAFGSGALNRNIKSLLRRGRDSKNLRYLLLKAQRMAATKTEFVVSRKQLKMQARSNSCREP